MAERGGVLWRLWHDRSACVARRSFAGLVWRYEQAPMRALLIGPEGLYLLDDMLLAGVLIMLRAPNRIDDTAPLSRAAPFTSGWQGI